MKFPEALTERPTLVPPPLMFFNSFVVSFFIVPVFLRQSNEKIALKVFRGGKVASPGLEPGSKV